MHIDIKTPHSFLVCVYHSKSLFLQQNGSRNRINHNMNDIPYIHLTIDITAKHNQSFNADLQNNNSYASQVSMTTRCTTA